jgi:hypothetical protein
MTKFEDETVFCLIRLRCSLSKIRISLWSNKWNSSLLDRRGRPDQGHKRSVWRRVLFWSAVQHRGPTCCSHWKPLERVSQPKLSNSVYADYGLSNHKVANYFTNVVLRNQWVYHHQRGTKQAISTSNSYNLHWCGDRFNSRQRTRSFLQSLVTNAWLTLQSGHGCYFSYFCYHLIIN